MIYKIANRYYVNISPMIFREVDLVVKNNQVVVEPRSKKIEVTANTNLSTINLADEKIKILEEHNKRDCETIGYRPNKHNRRK